MPSSYKKARLPGDPRSARRDNRRAELLESARAAIRREGRAASMEAIAREAGITKPIIYKHFGDRSGLAAALAVEFVDGLLNELTQALRREAPPREILRTTVDAYLAFVERDPQIYRFLIREAQPSSTAAGETLSSVIREIGRQVAVLLGEQLRTAGLDSGPAEPWAFGIVGMVHLAGDWWVERPTMSRARLVDYLTALLWDGMAGWSTTHQVTGPADALVE